MSPVREVAVTRSYQGRTMEYIFEAMNKAEEKFPGWPTDPVHGTAIMAEEAGEAVAASLDYYYGREETLDALKLELAQTGAMAIRMLMFLMEYDDIVAHAPRSVPEEPGGAA